MNSIQDFEDLLYLLEKYSVRYLIIGGLAFIFHAKPRYTKDIDLWIDSDCDNVKKANFALREFGSPYFLNHNRINEITQLGIAPNRIDLLLSAEPLVFSETWDKRIIGCYGKTPANWIDIDSLIKIKAGINKPKHQEDARILKLVKELNKDKKK